jgi:hypothetical protein
MDAKLTALNGACAPPDPIEEGNGCARAADEEDEEDEEDKENVASVEVATVSSNLTSNSSPLSIELAAVGHPAPRAKRGARTL